MVKADASLCRLPTAVDRRWPGGGAGRAPDHRAELGRILVQVAHQKPSGGVGPLRPSTLVDWTTSVGFICCRGAVGLLNQQNSCWANLPWRDQGVQGQGQETEANDRHDDRAACFYSCSVKADSQVMRSHKSHSLPSNKVQRGTLRKALCQLQGQGTMNGAPSTCPYISPNSSGHKKPVATEHASWQSVSVRQRGPRAAALDERLNRGCVALRSFWGDKETPVGQKTHGRSCTMVNSVA